MLVFIDESGDPGFKLAKGSTPLFAAAMVIFREAAHAQAAQARIEDAAAELGVQPEFKFSKCSDSVRDGFFEAVRDCKFRVRAIIVEKELIYSTRLRTDKESFYRFFVKSMLRFDGGVLAGADVVIDGSGERSFRRDLKTHIRNHTAPGVIRDVRFKDSRRDRLVQLADMSVGAIARSYRARDDRYRWRRMLSPHIDDVWEFK
jgi:hypothetical protein